MNVERFRLGMRRWSICFIVLLVFMGGPASGEIIDSSRRMIWQGNVGVPGGIPRRTTICRTAISATYGNDATDATSHIQGLINACPDNQVVYLPAGVYRTSGQITINKGVVIRGAGPSLTKIKMMGSSSIFNVSNEGGVTGSSIDIVSGATNDSNQLTLSNASTLSVGDAIIIDELNDASFVTPLGYGGLCSWCSLSRGSSGERSLSQMGIITAKSGNTITIDPSMHQTLKSGLSPQVIKWSATVKWAGIEDIYLENAGTAAELVQSSGWVYGWIKNIEARLGNNHHLWLTRSIRLEIRDSYFHELGQYDTESYSVDLLRSTTGSLVENNRFDRTKAAMMVENSGGNVFAYNYVNSVRNGMTYFPNDISNHAAHSNKNLYEGNYDYKIKYDFYWGSNSHNTALRNRVIGYQATPNYSEVEQPVVLAAWSRYHNFVGNILGSPDVTYTVYSGDCMPGINWKGIYNTQDAQSDNGDGVNCDPLTTSTLLRHGNYDYYSHGVVWDNAIADHTIPNSYYLSSKPSWWCNEIPWPSIGSDLSPMVSDIPAKRKFEGSVCTVPTMKYPRYPNVNPIP